MSEALFRILVQSHVFDLMIIFLAFFALYHILKYRPIKTVNLILGFYCVFCILFFVLSNTQVLYRFFEPKTKSVRIAFETLNSAFCVAELIVFSSFFFLLLKNKLLRKAIVFMSLLNSITILNFLLTIFNHSSRKADIFEASITLDIGVLITLFIFCILFYYSTMQNICSIFPKNKGVLWIVNSLFFYIILTLPFFFLYEETKRIDRLVFNTMYSLHYFCIANLLVSIGLAFKTTKTLTE